MVETVAEVPIWKESIEEGKMEIGRLCSSFGQRSLVFRGNSGRALSHQRTNTLALAQYPRRQEEAP